MRVLAASSFTRARLIALTIALIAVVCVSKPLAVWLQRALVLRMQTVDDSVFREAVAHAPDKMGFISKAWASGKIPHRQAVVRYLKEAADVSNPAAHEMLLAAARDGDAGLRELALPVLAARKDSALPALIAFQLRDADPDLRLLGLNQLGCVSSNAALPLIAAALDETNVIVAATAIAALQKISGKDFGVHVAKLLGEKAPPEAIHQFEAQRREARDWLSQHQTLAATPTNLMQLPALPEAGVVADFKLHDVSGNAVRLSDYRGKIVLLNFWTTWCTACQGEFATLNELQKKHPNDLVALGISLDSNSDAGAEDGAKRTTVEQRVARAIKARGIQYRILLDPESSVGARFNGGELPTNVLIDKQGRFARRFIGPRSVEVFEGMLAPLE